MVGFYYVLGFFGSVLLGVLVRLVNLVYSSFYFCIGIKKEFNKFFVFRIVMIGGKVRSWVIERGF